MTGTTTRATTGDRPQPAASATPSPARPSGRRKRVSLAPHRDQIESWVRQGATDEWIARALGTTPSSIQSFRSRSGIVRGGSGRSRSRSNSDCPARDSVASSPSVYVSVYEGVLEHGEGEEEEGYGLWLDPAVADDVAFKKGFSRVADVEVCIQPDRIVIRPAGFARSGDRDGEADEADDADDTVEAERLESIQSGLAGFEAALGPLPTSNRERGEVKFFEPAKGYGFIVRPDGSEIFVHKSQINGGDMLAARLPVSYEVGSNQRGLVAEDVKAAG